eukprot:scaffold42832_cov60-Phaeocystis_antarctica.AAC.1
MPRGVLLGLGLDIGRHAVCCVHATWGCAHCMPACMCTACAPHVHLTGPLVPQEPQRRYALARPLPKPERHGVGGGLVRGLRPRSAAQVGCIQPDDDCKPICDGGCKPM